MKRLLRIGIPSLALVAAGALALPAYRATAPSGCRPDNWVGWHLAMRQQCLEPSYVCEHMTSAEMLRDPEIAAAWREGFAAGRAEPVRGLSRMVGRMRAAYGCEPEPGAPPEAGASFQGELPPGHPPVGDACPYAGPGPGRSPHPAGPLPLTFEAAPTTAI